MKITKTQLKRIIKEGLLKEITADQARQAADYADELAADELAADDLEVINNLIGYFLNQEYGRFGMGVPLRVSARLRDAVETNPEFKDLDWAANDPFKFGPDRRPQKELMSRAMQFIDDFDFDDKGTPQ